MDDESGNDDRDELSRGRTSCRAGGLMPLQILMQGGENRSLPSQFSVARSD